MSLFPGFVLVACDHNCRTGTFAFGKLTSGSHVDLQLLHFSADHRTIKIRLIEGVLDTPPPSAPAIARFEIGTGEASLGHRARFYEIRGLNDGGSAGE